MESRSRPTEEQTKIVNALNSRAFSLMKKLDVSVIDKLGEQLSIIQDYLTQLNNHVIVSILNTSKENRGRAIQDWIDIVALCMTKKDYLSAEIILRALGAETIKKNNTDQSNQQIKMLMNQICREENRKSIIKTAIEANEPFTYSLISDIGAIMKAKETYDMGAMQAEGATADDKEKAAEMVKKRKDLLEERCKKAGEQLLACQKQIIAGASDEKCFLDNTDLTNLLNLYLSDQYKKMGIECVYNDFEDRMYGEFEKYALIESEYKGIEKIVLNDKWLEAWKKTFKDESGKFKDVLAKKMDEAILKRQKEEFDSIMSNYNTLQKYLSNYRNKITNAESLIAALDEYKKNYLDKYLDAQKELLAKKNEILAKADTAIDQALKSISTDLSKLNDIRLTTYTSFITSEIRDLLLFASQLPSYFPDTNKEIKKIVRSSEYKASAEYKESPAYKAFEEKKQAQAKKEEATITRPPSAGTKDKASKKSVREKMFNGLRSLVRKKSSKELLKAKENKDNDAPTSPQLVISSPMISTAPSTRGRAIAQASPQAAAQARKQKRKEQIDAEFPEDTNVYKDIREQLFKIDGISEQIKNLFAEMIGSEDKLRFIQDLNTLDGLKTSDIPLHLKTKMPMIHKILNNKNLDEIIKLIDEVDNNVKIDLSGLGTNQRILIRTIKDAVYKESSFHIDYKKLLQLKGKINNLMKEKAEAAELLAPETAIAPEATTTTELIPTAFNPKEFSLDQLYLAAKIRNAKDGDTKSALEKEYSDYPTEIDYIKVYIDEADEQAIDNILKFGEQYLEGQTNPNYDDYYSALQLLAPNVEDVIAQQEIAYLHAIPADVDLAELTSDAILDEGQEQPVSEAEETAAPLFVLSTLTEEQIKITNQMLRKAEEESREQFEKVEKRRLETSISEAKLSEILEKNLPPPKMTAEEKLNLKIKEIVTSEKTFIQNMRAFVDVFQHLLDAGNTELTPTQKKELETLLAPFKKLAENLKLRALAESLKDEDAIEKLKQIITDKDIQDTIAKIGRILSDQEVKHAYQDAFEMYRDKSFPQFAYKIQLMYPDLHQRLVDGYKKQGGSGYNTSFSDILIMPSQRYARYETLISEANSLTSDTHLLKKEISQLATDAKQFAKEINDHVIDRDEKKLAKKESKEEIKIKEALNNVITDFIQQLKDCSVSINQIKNIDVKDLQLTRLNEIVNTAHKYLSILDIGVNYQQVAATISELNDIIGVIKKARESYSGDKKDRVTENLYTTNRKLKKLVKEFVKQNKKQLGELQRLASTIPASRTITRRLTKTKIFEDLAKTVDSLGTDLAPLLQTVAKVGTWRHQLSRQNSQALSALNIYIGKHKEKTEVPVDPKLEQMVTSLSDEQFEQLVEAVSQPTTTPEFEEESNSLEKILSEIEATELGQDQTDMQVLATGVPQATVDKLLAANEALYKAVLSVIAPQADDESFAKNRASLSDAIELLVSELKSALIDSNKSSLLRLARMAYAEAGHIDPINDDLKAAKDADAELYAPKPKPATSPQLLPLEANLEDQIDKEKAPSEPVDEKAKGEKREERPIAGAHRDTHVRFFDDKTEKKDTEKKDTEKKDVRPAPPPKPDLPGGPAMTPVIPADLQNMFKGLFTTAKEVRASAEALNTQLDAFIRDVDGRLSKIKRGRDGMPL